MDAPANPIWTALSSAKDAINYSMSLALQATFPDRYLLETEEGSFDVGRFAFENPCTITTKPNLPSEFRTSYNQHHHSSWREPDNAWLEIEWEGDRMDLVTIGQAGRHCREERHFLVADSEAIAKRFFLAVCRWNSEVRGEVLVFNGHWEKDSEMFEDIKSARLDNLILAGDLKEEVLRDFRSFFDTKETYDRYGIAWKRGVLFLGPPGNGKTHMIKGLVNALGLPCLYVKSFKHPYSTDHQMMRQVFTRARNSAPCLLILEDLDALLDDQNRSFFLNEMDGFAANSGIMVVATTNHPERLDPAILDRPSRFDRKVHFNLPDADCRREYLALVNSSLEDALRLSEEELSAVAAATEGFSFAYLKELFVAAMMEWVRNPTHRSMASIMESQTQSLLSQMATEPEPPASEGLSKTAMQMRYMEQLRNRRR